MCCYSINLYSYKFLKIAVVVVKFKNLQIMTSSYRFPVSTIPEKTILF